MLLQLENQQSLYIKICTCLRSGFKGISVLVHSELDSTKVRLHWVELMVKWQRNETQIIEFLQAVEMETARLPLGWQVPCLILRATCISLCVAERRATRPNGEWKYSTRRHMLGPERPEAVSVTRKRRCTYRPLVIY